MLDNPLETLSEKDKKLFKDSDIAQIKVILRSGRNEMNIPKESYEAIEKQIADEDSPVGINAKKTHIIIISKLIEIEKRLEKLESKLMKE